MKVKQAWVRLVCAIHLVSNASLDPWVQVDQLVLTPRQQLAILQELEHQESGLLPFTDPSPWERLTRVQQEEFNRKYLALRPELQEYSRNQFLSLPPERQEHAVILNIYSF